MLVGLGCLLVAFLMHVTGNEPKGFNKTPFSEERRKYFKDTGLNKDIPKGKYNWDNTRPFIVDD